MTTILGVDPGSLRTGYGLIKIENKKFVYLDSGHIRMRQKAMTDRIRHIYTSLQALIEHYHPDEAAIEQVFMHINPGSALKLGQARGAAIAAIVTYNISVDEYSARQVKQSVVGYGNAIKTQVQHMIKSILRLDKVPQEDSADALAIAICHYNTQQSLRLIDKSDKFNQRHLP